MENRKVLFDDGYIDYELNRTNRHSTVVEVKNGKVIVRTGRFTKIGIIERLIINNKQAILDNCQLQINLIKESLEYIYIFGEKFKIHKHYIKDKKIYFEIVDNRIDLYFHSEDRDIIKIISTFKDNLYLELCETIVYERVKKLESQTGIYPSKVKFKNMKTRWGSCSSNGNISFNIKLCKFPYDVIDYVIVHELCHMKEMNHSKKFWKLVEDFVPNYKELRDKLKYYQ